jgi:membrane-bound lytic murein transglycosylase B
VLAAELTGIETAIRSPLIPATVLPGIGRRQQRAYDSLAAHPERLAATVAHLPAAITATVQANVAAQSGLGILNGVAPTVPRWRIDPPAPADSLLAYYHEAETRYGVPWSYLAAINFIESRMGRIHGDSSAGAQGPMQFLPSTWEEYGVGDINSPHDAIMAAARYLVAHGAPQAMDRAVYAYNPVDLYVDAVRTYATQLAENMRTFYAYYGWQVEVATAAGNVLLPEGYRG